jgi:class 3 adenylate cyclase
VQDPDVTVWLSDLGLERYAPAFGAAEVDFATLAELNSDDLRELGVVEVGPRRRLESALARLRDESKPGAVARETRRHLTILFCDVVGSTAMSSRSDPEQMSQMFRNFFDVLSEVIERRQGHVANRLGDGALIYFGYPQASEHAALQAALAAREVIEEVGARVRDPQGQHLRVRAGIASGMVVVDRSDTKSVFGDTPNVAARVQALARPGEVLVAESTYLLIRNLMALESRGEHSLKGLVEPMSVWRVPLGVQDQPTSASPGPATVLVGRSDELRRLEDLWAAATSGCGQRVIVTGEAGIGKSFLTSVFSDLVKEGGARVRHVHCSREHMDWPFYAFIREAHDTAEGTEEIDPELVSALGEPGSREALSLIRQRRESLIRGFVRRALAHDDGVPILLRFEDAHWSDPSSLEVLARIAADIRDLPVLLLITTREADILDVGDAEVLSLDPLDVADTRHVVAATISALDITASEEMVAEIAARADGVPYFAEELARSFAYANARGGGVSLDDVPATLQEALQFRVDALTHGTEVVQLAAVLGREVSIDVLRDLVTDEVNLSAALEELESAGLLGPTSASSPASSGNLIFRHQLVAEYVYDTILRRDRVRLHVRVADVLGHRLETEPQTLAYHEERAGRAEAAAMSWATAGRRAASRSADAEAAAYFRRSLALIPEFDDVPRAESFEIEVLLAFLPTVMGSDGYVRSMSASVNRVVELTARRSEPVQAFNALFLRWLEQLGSGGIDAAHELAQELQALADGIDSEITTLLMDRMMGTTHMFRGDLASAHDALEQFATRYDATRHAPHLSEYGATDNYTTVQCCRICVATLREDIEESRRLQSSTIQEAEALGRVHNLCHVLAYGGAFGSALRQEWTTMSDFAERLESVASEHVLPFWLAAVNMFRGIARASNAQDDADAFFSRGVDWYIANGVGFLLPSFRVLFASAKGVGGNDPRELEFLDASLDDGERWLRPEVLRLLAGEELRQGKIESGVERLVRSIDLANEQGSRLFVERSSQMLDHVRAGVDPKGATASRTTLGIAHTGQ